MFLNSVMRQRRWFWRLSILTVVLALTIGAALMQSLQISTVAALQSSIDAHKPVLTGLRLMAIGLIAYCWPNLIQSAQQSGRMSKEQGTKLKSLRWRFVGWLLAIELLLGQSLVWWLLQALPRTDV